MERRKTALDPDLVFLEKCNLIKDASSVPPSQKQRLMTLIDKMQMAIASRPDDEPLKFKLSDFEIGGTLGYGKFSTVFLARDRQTDFIVALKSVNKKLIRKNKVECDFIQETLLHSKFSHDHIVKFYTAFDDLVNWYTLTEYVPCGNIKKFRESQKENRVRSQTVVAFTYQMADALNYLHSLQIVHRDVKPENILIDACGGFKLTNFGPAASCTCIIDQSSIFYIAPEILENKEYDCKVDIWSLGILVYELLCGETPFQSKDVKFLIKKMSKGVIKYPEYVVEDAIDLINKLLTYSPDVRLSAQQIMAHTWVVS